MSPSLQMGNDTYNFFRALFLALLLSVGAPLGFLYFTLMQTQIHQFKTVALSNETILINLIEKKRESFSRPIQEQTIPKKPSIAKTEPMAESVQKQKSKPKSIDSLFDNISDDTAKIKNRMQKPKISDSMLKTLAAKPLLDTKNDSVVENKELMEELAKRVAKKSEVVNRLINEEGDIEDAYISEVKSFIHTMWHPSTQTAGNEAKVKIVVDSFQGVMTSYTILIFSSDAQFNYELQSFLEQLKAKKFPTHAKGDVREFYINLIAKE